jgi:putative hydrolase of the HAD superfamily
MDDLKQMVRGSDARKTLIFDADDTLWADDAFFKNACKLFADVIQDCGLDSADALERQERKDYDNADSQDFSSKTYIKVMVDVYKELCSESRKTPDPATEKKIIQIGNAAFDQRVMFPGAREMLESLKSEGYRLIMVTQGDKDVQWKKIRETQADKLFEKIYIVKVKDANAYLKVIDELSLDPKTTFMIGNSTKNDILPSLTAGMNSIHIPNETWAYERTKLACSLEDFKGRCYVATFVTDVPSIVRAHEKNTAKSKVKN